MEDEKGIREFIVEVLRKNGYRVVSASNVKEALEIFEKEKGNFNLLLTDVVLPDRTGISLANELISKNNKLCIVVSSGYLDDKSQGEIIHKKGCHFIQKPYELKQLLEIIKESLEKRSE
ncbi:MAG: response regulator [Candidatus Firestonebacteria bacterium]